MHRDALQRYSIVTAAFEKSNHSRNFCKPRQDLQAATAQAQFPQKLTHPDAVEDDVGRSWQLIVDVGAMQPMWVIALIPFVKVGGIPIGAGTARLARCDLWEVQDWCFAHITDAIALQQRA